MSGVRLQQGEQSLAGEAHLHEGPAGLVVGDRKQQRLVLAECS